MPSLDEVRLQDFRCFEQAAYAPASGVTLFVGDNAQGKTSILEAACILLRLQSPRTTDFAEIARFGSPGFGVAGRFAGRRLEVTFRDSRRTLATDGVPNARPADYLAHGGLIVWMGNDDLQLIRGGSEPRRRYLDFLASQSFADYRTAFLAYDKALRSRNRLLKDDRPDWRQIDAYASILAAHGTTIMGRRRELVAALDGPAAVAHTRVSGASESLTLGYRPATTLDLATAIEHARPEEFRRRVTAVGPHRDDLAIELDGAPAARFASEGQQRTLAVALKLAQVNLLQALRSSAPLILIDDVFGELDPARRNALLRALPADSQQLITTTHLHWLDPAFPPHRRFRVADHSLIPEI